MNKQCRCGPVAKAGEFEEWYDTVVKYVEPADIAAWMYDAWDAGRASAPAPVLTRYHVMSALALCPTDMPHSKRCEWIAEALNKAERKECAKVVQQVNPTMTRDELIAAAESIGMRFPTKVAKPDVDWRVVAEFAEYNDISYFKLLALIGLVVK